MDIRKLQRAIVDGLEDVKGQNIVVFNTEHLSPLFERVIIASGSSNRQTKALASGVREAVKSRGFPVMRTEGEENGEWIIVDCGAAVVHLMQPGIREYYHLEEIWGEKPVRMKLDTAPVRLVKAGDGDVAAAAAANKVRPAGKPPRSPAASATRAAPPARKARTASGTARSAPAGAKARPSSESDPAGQRGAPRLRRVAVTSATSAAVKPVGVKSAAVKSVGTKSAGTKSAGAKSASVRGTVTRTVGVKTAAKKAPARKTPRSA